MDDLTRCLYDFVCEKRLGSLAVDQEYQEALKGVELQQRKVEKGLDEEQQWELKLLIDTIAAQQDIEGEHLFQAAFSLSRELSGLVNCSYRTPG